MANYVVNKIICTEEILNEYFIDYYQIDENKKLEEPYISFNKLFGVKSLTRYLYPICAIVKAIAMFKEKLIWYSCEENKIYLSEFFWNGKRYKKTLYILKIQNIMYL